MGLANEAPALAEYCKIVLRVNRKKKLWEQSLWPRIDQFRTAPYLISTYCASGVLGTYLQTDDVPVVCLTTIGNHRPPREFGQLCVDALNANDPSFVDAITKKTDLRSEPTSAKTCDFDLLFLLSSRGANLSPETVLVLKCIVPHPSRSQHGRDISTQVCCLVVAKRITSYLSS